MKRTKEQILASAKQVLKLYRKGEHPLEQCCRACGVPYRSFAYWRSKHPEIERLYEKAMQAQQTIKMQNAGEIALYAQHKILSGFTQKTSKTKYLYVPSKDGDGFDKVPAEEVVTETYYPPNQRAIALELQRAFPKDYKQESDISPTIILELAAMMQAVERGAVSMELFETFLGMMKLPEPIKQGMITTLKTSIESVGIEIVESNVTRKATDALERMVQSLNAEILDLKRRIYDNNTIPEATDSDT